MLVLQNVVTISVNLADNVMLGDGLVIFCSQYWGKRQTQPMRRISAAAMQAGLLIAVLLFAAVSLFPEQAVGLFTTETAIIRGGGNAMFVVRMDLVSIWMIVIPLSFVMAFVVKASPAVVVCCLNADQIFKCVPAFLESHYGNWIRKLTREP